MGRIAVRPLQAAPSAGPLRGSWLAARFAAAISLVAGWVHLAYLQSHLEVWWAYGVFFLAVGLAQAAFSALVLHRPQAWIVLGGIAVNLTVVTMYVWSRTAGVPIGPHSRVVEHAGAIDMATTAAEIVLIGVLLAMLDRPIRRWLVNGLLILGALAWTLRLTGHLP